VHVPEETPCPPHLRVGLDAALVCVIGAIKRGDEVAQPDSNLQELLVMHTEAWNRHDLEILMSLFAEDCVFEASGGDEVCGKRYQGYGEVKEAFAKVFESMPDAQWAADVITAWLPTMEYPSGPSPGPCPTGDASSSTAVTS
jgi:hypothetical protein